MGAIGAFMLCFVPAAGAAVPEFLGGTPEGGKPGDGAGRLSFPWAVVADAGLPGHLYVISGNNNRIDELTPWGQFVKAWGWNVDRTAPAEELQVCTTVTECQVGSIGAGSGQISRAEAIAFGPAGDLYVLESANHRVQRFDREGHFLSMFGDGVNETAIENGRSGEEDVCPAVGHPEDACQAGISGTGAGQLGAGLAEYVSRLAICESDGRVFVGEGERIQVFAADGSFEEAIAMPAGKSVKAIAVDGSCNLYVAIGSEVRKLKASGPAAQFLEPTFTAESVVKALALDADKNLYATVSSSGELPERLQEFNLTGACLDCGTDGEGDQPGFDRPTDGSALWAIAVGSACGPPDVYVAHFGNGGGGHPLVSYLNIFGPPPVPALCPQPKEPPSIDDQYAAAVGTESARVAATINPKFWPDTTYRVEYGTAPCSEGGCEERPSAPGATLTSKVIRGGLPAAVPLSGLAPATTYHYRFIAQSGGGGPVVGEEETFTTFPPPPPPKDCPNRVLRTGASANLPDCRAYEMVSPLEKANGDIEATGELEATDQGAGTALARVDQATPGGEALAYASTRAFGGAVSSPWTSQYIARRGEGGWSTQALNPPLEGPTLYGGGGLPFFESLFKGFSEDLCTSWLLQNTDLALAPGAPAGIPSLYRQTNCGGLDYEPLIPTPPAAFGKALEGNNSAYYPTLQGFSADGLAAAFKAPGKLTEEASRTVVGESLDCSVNAPETTSSYRWLRNGEPIGSGTESTYVTKKADEGKAIQCQVAVTNEKVDKAAGGFVGSVQMTNPAQIVAPYLAQAPPRPPASIDAPESDAPLVLGGAGGQTLTCDAEEAKWGGSPTFFAYQWYRNGVALAGKTASTYTVSGADVAIAATFQCAVTATNPGGSTTRASANLTTSGPEPDPVAPRPNPVVGDVYETYLNREGALRLVSVMPGGQAAGSHSSVGTAQRSAGKRLYDSVAGAVSEDGTRVFWSAEIDPIIGDGKGGLVEQSPRLVHAEQAIVGEGPSQLYLRLNASEEQSALVHATGTGKLAKGSKTVTGVAATGGEFAAGEAITGVGIPSGTMIEEVSGATLVLSREALESKTNVVLDATESCSEPEKACTVQITKGPATFLAADPTASKALYTEGTNLYELDVDKAAQEGNATGAKTLIVGEVPGTQGAILGASKDLSRVYLVSEEVCSGIGKNSEGDEAQPGKANVYFYEVGERCGEGEFDFVATLTGHNDSGAYTSVPVNHRARVSVDGLHAAFMSQAPLTRFESTDTSSGEADAEVFLYDAPGAAAGEVGQLHCVSCNPGGARPVGRDLIAGDTGAFWVAAQIPGWENQWHASRVLSKDGSRLFFETTEALVSRDTNGTQDVYEWERAGSEKACLEEIGGELFVPQSAGCLSLISAGKGGSDAKLIDASESGSDVFFSTAASLVLGDPGLVDIYDAREFGGFPVGRPPVEACEGDSCQPPAVAPEDQTPASRTFEGQANLGGEGTGGKPRCPKGKRLVRRAGKQRCVPRHHQRKNHRRGGAGR